MEKPFVHLHNHTAYSLLDGAAKIDVLIERAVQLQMPAIAITDHGVMYGAVDFYKACQKAGIKPIIGCEVYVAPNSRFDKKAGIDDSPYHLVLLVENETGYHHLTKLVSSASLEGFYYKPRIDRQLLAEHHEGLIALSACLAGEVAQKLLHDDWQGAKETALWYQELFGADHYYLEIQNQGLYEQVKLNQQIKKLSDELAIPLVATNDTHYVYAADAKTQDVMMCIQMGKTLEDTNRMHFDGDNFYLKSYDEMYRMLGEYPQALDNTIKIADMCHFDFEFGHNHMPIFNAPQDIELSDYLQQLALAGLKERYGEPDNIAYERLTYELKIIQQMGYDSYFLIVWDFIDYARKQGIYVGPGRGSAAGSIVAYALKITDIDPLKYDLLFERFLNPERISMPDIDIDFCYERRGEVIDYVVQKYGQEMVSQIITFGTMAAKAAIRDVGRVMNVPIATVNRVAKMIPNELNITIEKAIKASKELRDFMLENEQIKELIETAQKLEGMPRHAGTHAAGVVISQLPLDYYLPLQKTNDGSIITQFAKENVEEIGLLKMDFLGLRTLTVINKAVNLIWQQHQVRIDFNEIADDDPTTYEMLAKGDSIGVFQMESAGLRNILRELRPTNLEEIIALVALYRPGPLGSGMAEDFIERKHGRKEIEYLHPSLEPILKPTYGVILYQEQVMRIASVLAGFTLGEADLLRRAMGKKKPEIIAGLKEQFIDGAQKNAVEKKTAEQIFALIEYFAGYGFNKSHSAAYAVVAFQTAYLKAHYPTEFMAALLTSVMDNNSRVSFYIEECRRMNIDVLSPDVNYSDENFQVVDGAIRFGLAAVKGVGKGPINAILQQREQGAFLSLQDFCARVEPQALNRRVMENLIKGGAFSSVEGTKAQLLQILDQCMEQGDKIHKDRNSSQLSLFDFAEETGLERNFDPIALPIVNDFTHQEVLAMEKEILGLYVSGHPLDEYREELSRQTSLTISELTADHDQEQVTIGGIITRVKLSSTKKGEMMAYLTVEDLSESIEVLVFPRVLEQYRQFVVQDMLIVIRGRFNEQEENSKIFAEELKSLNKDQMVVKTSASTSERQMRAKKSPVRLYLRFDGVNNQPDKINAVQDLLQSHQGEVPVYFYFPQEKKMLLAEDDYWCSNEGSLLTELSVLMGIENLQLK